MSDPPLRLPIEAVVDEAGFRKTEAWLKRLRDLQQAQPAVPRSAPAAPRAGPDPAVQAAKAERAILAQAQAQARLQTVTGDLAGAQQTYTNVLARLTPNSIAATRAQTQLAQVENKITAEATRAAAAQEKAAAATQKLAQSGGGIAALPRSFSGLSGEAAKAAQAVNQVVLGLGAVEVARKAFDLAQTAAQADLVDQRFDGMAEAAGTSGDALLKVMRAASGGEVDTLNLQLAANRAMMLGVADSAEEFSVLMGIARDRAQSLGTDTTTAFNDLVTGLGRGSAEILDNLGIMINAEEVTKNYAATLGKTVDQLTAAEKKQAIINAVIKQGKDSIEQTGGAANTAAGDYAKLTAAVNDAKVALGGLAGIKITPAVKDAAAVITALQGTGDIGAGIKGLLNQMTEVGPGISQLRDLNEALEWTGRKAAELAGIKIAPDFSPLQASVDAWKDLLGIQSEAEGQAASTAAASDQVTAAISYQSPAMLDAAAAHQEAANAAAMHTADILDDRQENILAAEAAGMLSEATRTAAAEHLIAGQQAELQSAKTELLQLQTQAAVEEFLRLNPTLSATQVASVGAANGLSPLQIQLAQTTIRANEAQGALAAFQRQAASAAAFTGIGKLNPTPNRGRGVVEGPRGAGAIDFEGIGTSIGNASQSDFRRVQKLYNDFAVAANKPARGGGGGAGSKLEDTRVQEMQKSEDAARAHYERLAEIEADYAEKSAEIARGNEVSKRASRADFYDDLSKATKDIGGEAAQQLSAEYEAAFAKSQEFAAKGQHQLAKEYLKTRQEQLGAEVDYQQDLARARQDGNQDEVQRLETIHQLQQDAQRAELQLVEQGGDSVQQARQQALDAEAQKYDESLTKIATTADRKEAQIVGSFENQASAADAWADALVSAAGRVDTAMSKVKPPTAPVSSVGASDLEGGVAAPTGGQGFGRATLGGRAAGGGGAVDVIAEASAIIQAVMAQAGITKQAFSALDLYRVVLERSTAILTMAADLRLKAQQASTPIPATVVQQLVDEARLVLDLTRHALVPTNERQVEIFERFASTVESSIGIVSEMAGLRETMSEALRNSQPFDVNAVVWLVRRAAEFTAMVLGQLVPLTEKQAESLGLYATGVGHTVEIIGGLATLRQTVTEGMENSAPFNAEQINFLVLRSKQFLEMVRGILIPLTEQQATELTNFASGVEAVVAIIGGVATLRQTVTEAMKDSAPFDAEQIRFLVIRAKQFTEMVRGMLIPLTEDQANELSRYADGVDAAVSIVSAMADLKATPPGPPINEAWIRGMAREAKRITEIVRTELLPTTQEQADELSRWAGAVQAAVGVAAAPLQLSGRLFEDYVSPSDAQLNLMATDAKRVTDRIAAIAATYSKDGLEASRAYAEGVGASFAALNDGLVFLDRLRFSDLSIDPNKLAQFQRSTLTTLDALDVLGARAAQIPPANLTALQTANAALSSTADALISMGAVPFGNLSAISSNLGAMGGGSTTTTTNSYQFSNTFVLPAGSTQQIAREVLTIVERQMRSHR